MQPLVFDDPSELLCRLEEMTKSKMEAVSSYLSTLPDKVYDRLPWGTQYYCGDEFIQPSLEEVRKSLTCVLFRGQRKSNWILENGAKRSYQLSSEANNIISSLRCNYFRKVISSNDNWRELTTGKVGSKPYRFYDDERYLAQHYDIPTSLIDFTMDPKIAMYFACTVYNQKTRVTRPLTYEDVMDKDSQCGKIFQSDFSLNEVGRPFSVIPNQLALRPGKQKGFMLDTSRSEKFQVTEFVFKHDLDFSEQIWKDFGGDSFMKSGKDEYILNVAGDICSHNEFDNETYCKIVKRYGVTEEVQSEVKGVVRIVDKEPAWFRELTDSYKNAQVDFEAHSYDSIVEKIRNPESFDADSYYDFLASQYINDLNAGVQYGIMINGTNNQF